MLIGCVICIIAAMIRIATYRKEIDDLKWQNNFLRNDRGRDR
jgi:hypothetical protein